MLSSSSDDDIHSDGLRSDIHHAECGNYFHNKVNINVPCAFQQPLLITHFFGPLKKKCLKSLLHVLLCL